MAAHAVVVDEAQHAGLLLGCGGIERGGALHHQRFRLLGQALEARQHRAMRHIRCAVEALEVLAPGVVHRVGIGQKLLVQRLHIHGIAAGE